MGIALHKKPTRLELLKIEPLDDLRSRESTGYVEVPVFYKFLLILVGGTEWMIQTGEPPLHDHVILYDLFLKYSNLRAEDIVVEGGGFIRSKPEKKIVEVFGTTRIYGPVKKEHRIELRYLILQRFPSWNIVFIEQYSQG